MTLQRVTHYWLWFGLFGLVSATATLLQTHKLGSEDLWMFALGGGGLLAGSKSLAAKAAKPFDLFTGVTFFAVGLLGILHNFGIDLVSSNPHLPQNSVQYGSFMGISLCLLPSLLHTVLGFLSLNYAIKSPSAVSQLLINTSEKGG